MKLFLSIVGVITTFIIYMLGIYIVVLFAPQFENSLDFAKVAFTMGCFAWIFAFIIMMIFENLDD